MLFPLFLGCFALSIEDFLCRLQTNFYHLSVVLFKVKSISLRQPRLDDGMDLVELVASCPPLDVNSSYCNLLQCSHFARTSVAAEQDGGLVGFVSGYIIPEKPDTLFIWQVAVLEKVRGCGLASRMLDQILTRHTCNQIRYLETTITEDNQASWALFKRFAKTQEADFQPSAWMDKEKHFAGQHDSEVLVRIGPFQSQN